MSYYLPLPRPPRLSLPPPCIPVPTAPAPARVTDSPNPANPALHAGGPQQEIAYWQGQLRIANFLQDEYRRELNESRDHETVRRNQLRFVQGELHAAREHAAAEAAEYRASIVNLQVQIVEMSDARKEGVRQLRRRYRRKVERLEAQLEEDFEAWREEERQERE